MMFNNESESESSSMYDVQRMNTTVFVMYLSCTQSATVQQDVKCLIIKPKKTDFKSKFLKCVCRRVFQGFIGPPGIAGPPGMEGERVCGIVLDLIHVNYLNLPTSC